MIAGVLGSKPNEILLSFQDRIEAQMRSLQLHGRPTSLSKALAQKLQGYLGYGGLLLCSGPPARFGGFAALPTASPDKAAQELERRVRGQKFAGAIINGHNRGRYLDDRFFAHCLTSL
jgi:hypothetical protein